MIRSFSLNLTALPTASAPVPASAPPAQAAPAPPAARPDPPGYTGPKDGLSHYNPKAARWLHPLNKAAMALVVRKTVIGKENLPKSGAQMLCFNHQSYLDPPLVASLSNRDWRFMAAKEQFTGLVGKAMTAMGAFPVERGRASLKPLDVSIDLLNDGVGVAIFPEGRIWDDGSVHELKEGAAMVGLHSTTCESLIPGAIHYRDHKAGFGSRLLDYAAAAAVTAGGIALATAGGPLGLAAGAVTGLLSGALVGAVAGVARVGLKADVKDIGTAALKGAGIGALLGGAAGGAGAAFLGSHAMMLAGPLSVGAGLTTLAIAKGLSARQDAIMVVGKGIDLAPYRAMADKKDAREKLTADLHAAMVALKEEASQK